jgi:AcrR family transcriptional regulator
MRNNQPLGVRERRNREKQELRQSILDAAREIALGEGWQAVTIRRIADRIEYSPPTIYDYFASKDDILFELMRLGFKLLLQGLQEARQSHHDPADQVSALCKAWWRFAWTYPDLYQVLHGLGGVNFLDGDDRLPEGVEAFRVGVEVLQELVKAENLDVPDPIGQLRILWATLHGLVSLTMGHRIGTRPEETEYLVEVAAQNFVTALRTTYPKR